MPADKYRFVSPGVFITEVDQSQVPNLGNVARGPVIIGRSATGPAYTPTVVETYSDFVKIFGDTVPGGTSIDVWRNGNFTSPMYATYAAKAYLANNGPITFVRLLGSQDANAGTTKALGAAGWSPGLLSSDDAGIGAYGLFIAPSGAAGGGGAGREAKVTGSLAAIFYCTGSTPILSGTLRGTGADTTGNAKMIKSVGVAGNPPQFKIRITGANGQIETKSVDWVRSSQNYIRAAFNTDPTRINAATNSSTARINYWLGETFEKAVTNLSASDAYWGVILGLNSGSAGTGDGADFLGLTTTDKGPQSAATGWFISQDTNGPIASFNPAHGPENLFRIHGLTADGEETQKQIKISIADLRIPTAQEKVTDPYPSFTLQVRALNDLDKRPRVLETFSNLNLNPQSANYIARRIGDKRFEYDAVSERLVQYGNYSNISQYIRVEMDVNIDVGSLSAELLPFGVKGPLKYKDFLIKSGAANSTLSEIAAAGREGTMIAKGYRMAAAIACGAGGSAAHAFTGSYTFPALQLVASSSTMGFVDPRDAFWGVNVNQQGSQTRFDDGVVDLLRVKPMGLDSWTPGTDANANTTYQYVFTLDNLIKTGSLEVGKNNSTVAVGDAWYYQSGSRASDTSWTAASGAASLVNTHKINKFTTVLHGGFDGLDITDRDPFRNTIADGDTATGGRGDTDVTNYIRASLNRAINIVADPEVVEYNLATIPGITVPTFTNRLIDICEDRGDALAVIDVQHDYVPVQEGDPDSTSYPAMPNVTNAVAAMRARTTDSSYGCAFYPFVQTVDGGTGQMLWIPASAAALGTMGSSAAKSELWFAPAGFNRGGLSKGAAGIPVTNVRRKLTSRERDDLYEVRVNPIASFPSEGIVVFGQKTLQLQQSALDRINVRRLMIYLKKRISQIANLILFDQNVPSTWARFIGLANPILKDVQAKFGLEDYRLILDETTTTPEMRDRNIMYAKIFLKPARAIEFIAIDFLITSTGASFED